jgi:hypothetical protein
MGELVVLKVGWCHDEALHEADGLRAWDGQGTVRLYDYVVRASGCFLEFGSRIENSDR